MIPELFTRRSILSASVATFTGGALATGASASELAKTGATARSRVLRFAHLTDTHVQSERRGDEGFAVALKHVQQQDDPPEFIMFGGDNVMNVDSRAGAAKAADQLAVWNRCLKDELGLPYKTCIGNHDILNLDPDDGKKWALDAYGLEQRYYWFDRNGWRFVVLDSTSPEGGGYKGRLDEAQLTWLEETLASTPAAMPVIVVSHIPILAACAYFDGDNEKTNDWVVPGAWMHLDARRIKDLFRHHPQVRVAISGHIHLVDEVRYNDVTYYCNGAVCGGWWRGPYQEFGNGYALVDLYDDGSSERFYVPFPWPSES